MRFQIPDDKSRAATNPATSQYAMMKGTFDPIFIGSNMAGLLLISRYLSPRDLRPDARGWSEVFRWADGTVCEVRRRRAPTDLPEGALAYTFAFTNSERGWTAKFSAVFWQGRLFRPEKLLRLRSVEPFEARRDFNAWVRAVQQPLPMGGADEKSE